MLENFTIEDSHTEYQVYKCSCKQLNNLQHNYMNIFANAPTFRGKFELTIIPQSIAQRKERKEGKKETFIQLNGKKIKVSTFNLDSRCAFSALQLCAQPKPN